MGDTAENTPLPGFAQHVWVAGVLGNLHDACIALATCRASVEQEAFFSRALTYGAGLRALEVAQRSATCLLPAVRMDIGGVNRSERAQLGACLPPKNSVGRDRVWHAMDALVPAMLMGLRRLRRRSPEVFNPVWHRS